MKTVMRKYMNMRNVARAGAILLVAFWACEDPEYITAVPNPQPSGFSANFLFVNAAPDAPSLDMYINNVKTGTSAAFGAGQTGYTNVQITSGGAGGFTANTNIRAKASSGTIGGVLGSSDVIYRAGNNNTNNFAAINGARYTLFALDTISRPKPVRKLNASNFGDTTFFNPLTGTYISVVEKAALPPAQRAKVVPIGVVPLGASDPGGVRFYLLRDNYPAFTSPNTTQSAIRLVQASPRNYTEPLWVRLNPVSTGSIISLGTSVPYILSFANPNGTANFTPSVGSRTVTGTGINFTLQNTNIASVPNDYRIEVSKDAGFTQIIYTSDPVQFLLDKVYTVVIRGVEGGTGNRALGATVVQHN
ncbi:MAG: DUF4397 domain-containing protein [Flammeovirgaceae bacterium]|nr:MAG: DUF4397 domain-containing protein [Flammeovirgaceae bacterium]